MTRESFLAGLGVLILRLLFSTIRLKVNDGPGLGTNSIKGPVIICFWHNRILGITIAFIRRYPKNLRDGVTVLTSPSKDGEILARVVGGFKMGAVRGSSSRRGSQALRELVTLIEKNGDIAITPDGPRGPRYKLGPGAVSLAQLTGAKIVPMHAKFSRCVRMKTWDGFIIPLPFSTVSVTVGEPISVPRELTDEEFEATRLGLETLLKNEAD
jgi:lysophospholipid acyltransferase (LPLAT)-like uncharacterized protein